MTDTKLKNVTVPFSFIPEPLPQPEKLVPVATEAQPNGSIELAVDGSDDVFVMDSEHREIQRIDSNRVITTVAASGKKR